MVQEADHDPDPLVELARWLREEETAAARPDAMTLATATPDGRPSARMVLLRGLDERGLRFFTNLTSRKALELERNPRAAVVLHWAEQGRQVRVEGTVERVSDEESHAYWRTRPRGSQVAAWASPQSQPLADRAALDELYAEATQRFEGGDVPRPEFWGGYRIVPEAVEFWTHRDDRLHDRIRYERGETGWRLERLAP